MEEDDAVDGDFYLLAKSYFDCREYRRAAHVLRDQSGKKAVFLRCYALYLVCHPRLLYRAISHLVISYHFSFPFTDYHPQ